VFALCCALSSCGAGPNFGAQSPGAGSFTAIEQSILQPSCAQCHSTGNAQGGFSVSSYAELMLSPGAVTPYQPQSSQLYNETHSGKMPREGSPLTPAQMQTLYDWIVYGAQNN
jgi:mono/diheme cytochrome c family protein